MLHKISLFLAALCFYLGVTLPPGCTVHFGGESLPGVYSFSQLHAAQRTADAILAELSGGEDVRAARCETRLTFSALARGETAELTDALLRHSFGVQTVCAVRVEGTLLGFVSSQAELEAALSRTLADQQPMRAVVGSLGKSYTLSTVYAGPCAVTPVEDMVLLLLGRAGLVYYDASGRRA